MMEVSHTPGLLLRITNIAKDLTKTVRPAGNKLPFSDTSKAESYLSEV